jgi:O-antigen/teichoic acid export membrane protein
MLRRTARRDRLIGLFVLGLVLLNPPILNLFGGTIFGWPALYLYMFASWAALIAGVALAMRGASTPDTGRRVAGKP